MKSSLKNKLSKLTTKHGMRNFLVLLVLTLLFTPSSVQAQPKTYSGTKSSGVIVELDSRFMKLQTMRKEHISLTISKSTLPEGLKIGEQVEVYYHVLSVMRRTPEGRKGCARVNRLTGVKRISR